MTACNVTPSKGSKEGDNVTLQQAMHRLNVNQSCLGCHEAKLNKQICAGCHTSFEKKRQQGTASCANCHMVPTSRITHEVAAGRGENDGRRNP